METITIASDFGDTLGGRWIKLGPNSGEDFYNRILEKKFIKAREEKEKLVIKLDGTKGYPSSFLDQSFGELARKYGVDVVRSTIKFESVVFNWVIEYINKEIWDKTK